MTLSPKLMNDFRYLLNRAFDGTLTEEEAAHFERLFGEHPALESYYFKCINLHLSLRELASIVEAKNEETAPSLDETLRLFSQWENTAPALKISSDEDRLCGLPVERPRMVHKVNRFLFAVAIGSLAAFVLLAAYVGLNPRPGSDRAAVLTDAIDAQWAVPMQNGDRLKAGSAVYILKAGLAKVTLENGVIVTFEGPAQFAFRSGDEMKLDAGRLYARVPVGAEGFTVRTPGSTLVDFGTEFGIKIENDGAACVHMFKGKASLLPSAKRHARDGVLLTAGQARRIDLAGRIEDIPLAQTAFVRNINSANRLVWRGRNTIDLASLFGGGSGLAAARQVAIDPASGEPARLHLEDRYSSNAFVEVPHNPYIDGVFVPDGTVGQIVTSRGDVFKDCPPTSGCFYTEITNDPGYFTRRGLQDAGSAARSGLLLHANTGITFDLDAVRAEFPGRKITRFQTRLRISELAPRRPEASFWVLVDGIPRYSRLNVTQKGDVEEIRIDLSEADRFLTLAATEGVTEMTPWKTIDSDWCVFAEPTLWVD